MDQIKYHKQQCKIRKKLSNENNLTLIKIQHNYAKELGYKSWSDLINQIRLNEKSIKIYKEGKNGKSSKESER